MSAREAIIDAAVKEGCLLEYNANGYRREWMNLRMACVCSIHTGDSGNGRRADVPVLIGSDCHSPESYMMNLWI